jgi:hypothetical protein
MKMNAVPVVAEPTLNSNKTRKFARERHTAVQYVQHLSIIALNAGESLLST